MRAAVLQSLGHDLILQDIAAPTPGLGEILIRVAACGLNFADTLVQKGTYQDKPTLPCPIGMEIAGTVLQAPEDSGFAPGARVAGYSGFGGLAQIASVRADLCVHLPDDMPFEQAAGFLLAYGTSEIALNPLAQLQAGERLVVTGASGGVGLAAVELGTQMGAQVIAVARGPHKLGIAQQAGAAHLLNAEDPDLRSQIKALGGSNVVIDTVGGPIWEAVLRSTAPGARVFPIGFASGEIPQIPANYLLVKNITLFGFYMGGYRTLRPSVLRLSFERLLDLYSLGKLHPHISHVLPLDEANAGLDLLRTRKATGKVVITIPSP